MIYGDVELDPSMVTAGLSANTLLLGTEFSVAGSECLVRVAVQMSSQSQRTRSARVAVYDSGGRLAAVTADTQIAPLAQMGWQTFLFTTAPQLNTGTYRAAIHVGPTVNAFSALMSEVGTHDVVSADFAAGSPSPLPAPDRTDPGELVMMTETIRATVAPDGVTDDYLAQLPFDVSQRIFGSSAPISTSIVPAMCGWYGTSFDARVGSLGIVRSGGPLESLVGERLQVSRPALGRQVRVYAIDERDFPDDLAGEDLLLTGRAFLALADQTWDEIDVTVGVLQ